MTVITDDVWDPLHTSNRPNDHWTTTNLGEAVPGVVTPLALGHWGLRGHNVHTSSAYAVGVVSRAERDAIPPPEQRTTRCFYGRIATRLEATAMFGDRIPGLTGEEVLASLFGKAPEGMTFAPTRRRYPEIAVRFPYTMVTIPSRLRKMCAETDRYWRAEVQRASALDLQGARAALRESLDRYQFAINTHVIAMFGSFKPLFDALEQLVQQAGTGDLAVLSGTGGAEMAVVGDIWRASRGQIDVTDIVRAHGFHGPGEGEVSSRVWRVDPTPLQTVVEHYRSLPDAQAPDRLEAAKAERIVSMTEEVIAALPGRSRPGARLLLKLARQRIPDRGRGKRAFLQGIDVSRMSAHRIGEHLVAAGVLAEPDDAFYLTDTELTGTLPSSAGELVARRRERRDFYQGLELRETTWAGMPDVISLAEAATDGGVDDKALSGIGASRGVVEGRVRVVEDPTFADVEPGEILVASTTDPSWCSIMYISAGLVIDLGGMLSHAAVVAREIEIPCVVATKNATRRLRTGDRVRIDGNTGTVDVLERVGVEPLLSDD
jgi:phosphohistidine swiveling domain-containing protein